MCGMSCWLVVAGGVVAMATADYRCSLCEYELELDFVGSPPPFVVLDHMECPVSRLDRVWVAPNLGSMSSGEPPRM